MNKVRLSLDLKPALTAEMLDKRLLRDFEAYKNKSVANCLKELLPAAIIEETLKRSGIDGNLRTNSVTREQLSLIHI